MIVNKNIKIIFNYILGPLLFILLSYVIVQQIRIKSNFLESWFFIKSSFDNTSIFYFLFVVVLMGINWSLEAIKWKISVRQVQKVSFSTACKAVFSGISFSIIMPNRTGEYLGRVLYMEEGKRLRMVALTVLGSISQLIVTLFFGLLAIAVFSNYFSDSNTTKTLSIWAISICAIGFLLFFSLFYFKIELIVKLLARWKFLKKYADVIQELEQISNNVLLKLIFISVIRYFVFMLQYYLLFKFFGVEIVWLQAIGATAILFLIMAIMPTIALFEIVQKIVVANELFYLFTTNLLGVGFVITTIWLVNLILPAIIGSLLIGRIKLFKIKNE